LITTLAGFSLVACSPSDRRPVGIANYLSHYRQAAAPPQAGAADRLREAFLEELARARIAAAQAPLEVVEAPGGPISGPNWLRINNVEFVMCADDLSRSVPDLPAVELVRPALADAVRSLAGVLAERYPGRSVEVRVPPFVAVQCGGADGDGPRHTRGTPPNVIETEPVTFLRLCAGRVSWAAAVADASVRASGNRADLSRQLPLL
jgi:hypothetical protein